jgi:hypothetical protein
VPRAGDHLQLRPFSGWGVGRRKRLAQGARSVLAHPHDDGHDGGQAAA